MEKVLLFLKDNWGLVFAILSLIVTIILGAKGKFNDLLSKTMLFAEKAMARAMEANGKITGQQKKDFVCDYVYGHIPKWMKAFIAREYIAGKIENIITDVKDIEDDGILNCSVNKKE
jgi:hypothetical protein